MNLTVFAGVDPSSNLNELFRRVPLSRGPLCAVVPDSRSVTAFERRLCHMSGEGFLGHRVFTMSGLAMEIVSHAGNHLSIIDDHIKRALVNEIVKSMIKENSSYYTISHYPGFIDLVLSFLRDVRGRGDGRESREQELTSIASAYDSHLKRLNLTDHEGAVIHALEGDRIERFSAIFHGPLIVDGFYDLTEKQFQLIERLIRCFQSGAVTLVYDHTRPSLFALPARLLSRYQVIGSKIIEVASDESTSPSRVLAGFMGGSYPEHGNPEEVQIHTFRNESSEADWAALTIGKLLETGISRPENILVVSRNQKAFGNALEHALHRQGIPIDGGFPRPLVTHPIARFILDVLDASLHAENEDLAARVHKSSYMRKVPAGGNTWNEQYEDRAWTCMISEVDSPAGFIESIKKVVSWLRIGDNLDGGGDVSRAFSERVILEKLFEIFDEFVRIYFPFRKMLGSDEFQRLLYQFLSTISIIEPPSPLGGVAVVDCNHARYITRDVVFFLGLDDTSFPKAYETFSLNDPDQARELLTHEQLEEPLLFYLSMCGSQRLYLSFPGIDNEGRDHGMSPYLREIRDGIASWSTQQFHARIPGAGLMKSVQGGRGQNAQLIRELKKNFSDAPGIFSFLLSRDSGRERYIRNVIDRYIEASSDQIVNLFFHPSFQDFQDTWHPDRIFSVTDLEIYQVCPFKFFLRVLLNLSVEKEIPNEIDPRLKGRLIHSILAQFYEEQKKRTGEMAFTREELPECKTMMTKIVERVFTELDIAGYGVPTVIYHAEKKFIHMWMEAFLDHEMRYFEETQFRPNALEVEFGRGEKISQYPALKIVYENNVLLVGGRVDRIDVMKSGENRMVRVIDYKTGNPSPHGIKSFLNGKVLQLPLYLSAVAASIFPGTSVHDAVYFNLQEMKIKEFKNIPSDGWEGLIRSAHTFARLSAEGICSGVFPMSNDTCGTCEFTALCRGRKVVIEDMHAAE